MSQFKEIVDSTMMQIYKSNQTGYGVREMVCDVYCKCPELIPPPLPEAPGVWTTYIWLSSVPDWIKFAVNVVLLIVLLMTIGVYRAIRERHRLSQRQTDTNADSESSSDSSESPKHSSAADVFNAEPLVQEFTRSFEPRISPSASSFKWPAGASSSPGQSMIVYTTPQAEQLRMKIYQSQRQQMADARFESAVKINNVLFALAHLIFLALNTWLGYKYVWQPLMVPYETTALFDIAKVWVSSTFVSENIIQKGITPFWVLCGTLRILYGVWESLAILVDVVPFVGYQCRVHKATSSGMTPAKVRQMSDAKSQ